MGGVGAPRKKSLKTAISEPQISWMSTKYNCNLQKQKVFGSPKIFKDIQEVF